MIKRVALILVVLCIVSVPFAVASAQDDRPPNIATGLIACWDMDESGGTRIDSAGGMDAYVQGGVPSARGLISRSAAFNAETGDFLSIPYSLDMDMQSIGIFTWFKRYAGDDPTTLLMRNADWIILSSPNGDYSFGIGDGACGLTAYTAFNDSDWHSVAASFDTNNDNISLILDSGVYSITTRCFDDLINPKDESLYMGFVGSYYNTPPVTAMDQTAVWNRPLTTDEVIWLDNNGSARTCAEIMTATGTPGAETSYTLDYLLSSGIHGALDMRVSAGDIGQILATGALFIALILSSILHFTEKWTS